MNFHRRPNFKYSTPLSVLGVRLPVVQWAFECMDVLSSGNMLTGDPPLPAYTWTQKASTSPRMQLEGPRSCGSGRCDHKASVAPAGSKREQHRFGGPCGLAKPVLCRVVCPWTIQFKLAQLFSLSKLHSKSQPETVGPFQQQASFHCCHWREPE